MTINRTSLSATPIQEGANTVVIEMRSDLPRTDRELDPPQPPGKIIGYYNGTSGFVELYVVSYSGTALLPI